MLDGKIKEEEEVASSATNSLSKQVMKLNVFDDDDADKSDDDNDVEDQPDVEDDDEEDEIIQGLSNFSLDPEAQPPAEDEYTSKGPVFRSVSRFLQQRWRLRHTLNTRVPIKKKKLFIYLGSHARSIGV